MRPLGPILILLAATGGCASRPKPVPPPVGPTAADLVALIRLDNRYLVETSDLIARADDLEATTAAGRRLVALADSVAASPDPNYRRRAHIRIYDAMVRLRVDVVDLHCAQVAQTAVEPAQRHLAMGVLHRHGLAAAPAPAVASAGTGTATGTMADASSVIAAMRGRFRACYDAAFRRRPQFGRTTATVAVSPAGAVERVRWQADPSFDAPLMQCLTDVIEDARFQPPHGGVPATVSISVNFLPAEPTAPVEPSQTAPAR